MARWDEPFFGGEEWRLREPQVRNRDTWIKYEGDPGFAMSVMHFAPRGPSQEGTVSALDPGSVGWYESPGAVPDPIPAGRRLP